MARYRVSLADGGEEVSGVATSYEVSDDGTLEISLADGVIAQFSPGSWIQIHEDAPSLAGEWPPPELDDLLSNLHSDLCSHGHCEPLGTSKDFDDPALNDMQAFISVVLGRIGIGEHSQRSYRTLADLVRSRTEAMLQPHRPA